MSLPANSPELILASASPRRSQLLERIGMSFRIKPSHIHEPPYVSGSIPAYAETLAQAKANDISKQHPDALVIGADTIVVIDGQVLGKPRDRAHAMEMLKQLSGAWHEVITAYAILNQKMGIECIQHVSTRVHFVELSASDILRYLETGSADDKAGAYGIQDLSAIFVDEIQGCFYNVVGFPVSHFYGQYMALCESNHITPHFRSK